MSRLPGRLRIRLSQEQSERLREAVTADLRARAERVAWEARQQLPRGARPDRTILDDPLAEPLRVPSERADQPKELPE